MARKQSNQRFLIFSVAGLALTGVVLLLNVMATQAVENDGRINLVHHLGGDVIYCVDASGSPVNNYAEGGLQLLSQAGQKLFFVPAADIDAVAELPEVNTVIAEGAGSYGPVILWRLSNGKFALTGVDEHGKAYQFEWTGCLQVGEVGSASSGSRPGASAPNGSAPTAIPTATLLPPQSTPEVQS